MKEVIRDLVACFVPLIITMFVCYCMDISTTTSAFLGSLIGSFFLLFDAGKARKAIRWATSTCSNVYSFLSSDRTDVYKDLTPVHQVTVSSHALFLIENLQPTTTPEAVIRRLTKNNNFEGKGYLEVAIPVDTKQQNAGSNEKALVSIPREYLIGSRILQMCNDPPFVANRKWTITEVSSRQLLKFKSTRYWKVSGKTDQSNVVTTCPLLKDIKTQFGYSLIDCGSCLFHCEAFSAMNNNTKAKFIRNIASKGIQRMVVKADTLDKAKEALNFCQKYRHFLYVNIELNSDLETQDVRACMRCLKQIKNDKGFACVGGVPLCYQEGKLTNDKQLSNFKELVPFCYNKKIPIYFYVGPKECIDRDFSRVLSYYKKMIYSWCIVFDEESKFTDKTLATLIKFGCFVMVDVCYLKYDSRVVSLLEKKIIPVEKILLRSNAPFSFIGKSKEETWHSMKDFEVHFLRKQLRYLHPESLENMYSEDGCSAPTILHCVIELLAGIVDVPPLSLSKILTKNAESFFKFSDPSISNSLPNTG